jgi:glutamine amidotransferase
VISRTTLVFTGQGNLRSLRSALEHVGVSTVIAESPSDIESASSIVLPGVASTLAISDYLRREGMWQPVAQYLHSGGPVLGICAGMQVLATHCTEGADHQGFSAMPGTVSRITKHPGLRVPHVGWSPVMRSSSPESTWFPEGDYYFTHSYCYTSTDESEILARTLGTATVPAALQLGNVIAAQFHPEKSQDLGLEFLRAWRDRA